jgi:uncharacterized protein YkwD
MPQHSSIPVATLALLLVPAALQAQSTARPQPDIAEVNRLIIEDTNAFRRAQGARPTTPNRQLGDTARYFADFMARTDRYGHQADGSQASQRAKARGYDYCMVSENIGYRSNSAGFRTEDLARGMVDGWKRSPGHRHNMLDPDATDTGVAVAQSPRSGRYYAVQMFGRPRAAHIEFSIVNRSTSLVRYEVGGEWFQLPPRVTRTHEQCRAETLTLRLPGETASTIIQPAAGERYAVERVGSRYRLTKG